MYKLLDYSHPFDTSIPLSILAFHTSPVTLVVMHLYDGALIEFSLQI